MRGNKSSRATDTSQEKDDEDNASQEDSSKKRQELPSIAEKTRRDQGTASKGETNKHKDSMG